MHAHGNWNGNENANGNKNGTQPERRLLYIVKRSDFIWLYCYIVHQLQTRELSPDRVENGLVWKPFAIFPLSHLVTEVVKRDRRHSHGLHMIDGVALKG